MTVTRDLSRFKQPTSPSLFPEYDKVVKELETFATKLDSDVLVDPNLEVLIEPGFKVNAGQQFKIVVVVKTQGYRDILMRAYVPDTGYPAVLSFVGEEQSAADEQALVQLLYEAIPSNSDIQSRLRALRALAQTPRDAE